MMKISKTLVDEFYRIRDQTKVYSEQRIGQAFYNHFDLHKVNSEKVELSKLYEADGQEARKIITSMTDYEN